MYFVSEDELAALRNSGQFDGHWYLEQYPDVSMLGMDPATHYLWIGKQLGRAPRADVAAETSSIEPMSGVSRANNRNQVTDYSNGARNIELEIPKDSGMTINRDDRGWRQEKKRRWHERSAFAAVIEKYSMRGKSRMKREYDLIESSGLFDPEYYLTSNPDVAAEAADPLRHYLEHGWREARNPNPLFDTQWYLDASPDVLESGINPLLHYLRFGGFCGRDPGPKFDSSWYLAEYPDVEREGTNPLAHFLQHGQFEGRLPVRPGSTAVGMVGAYERWVEVNKLSDRDIIELRAKLAAKSAKLPKISVVTPVYNTSRVLLEELIDSVRAQQYENWELCLVNDASPSSHVVPLLDGFEKSDERIRVAHLASNGGISVATNAAVAMASGDVVVFLDHDDLLTCDCLAELAIYYADHPDADIVYSDDDKIDLKGRRYAPQFKPDWSPTLLLSWMYMGHVFSVRRELFEALGGFRPQFDGSQDYDFALRAAEVAGHVGHIPKILYHWRAVEGSTAMGGDAKPDSMHRGRAAVEEALKRRGMEGALAVHPDWAALGNVGIYDLVFPHEGPSVTIIIPTKNNVSLLRNCLESLKKTLYRNYSVLILDNESCDNETIEYLRSINESDGVRVVRIASPSSGFSFANLNNEGAKLSSSDYILFLNNDTEVISPNWLSQMVGYAKIDGVGAVGARLYFADGTIQHAGIVHGYHEGLVGHAFRGLQPHEWGYLGFVRSSREYSGVTAACLLTPRALFEELGGFDEQNFAVAYNDVDYCYRLVKSGRSCVYCASAELWHYEGKSRGYEDDPTERANLRRLYGDWVDPWYNPNLSLENERFEIEPARPETSSDKPIRLVAVSHNLNREGAPIVLMDQIIALSRSGAIDPLVLSPTDGPLRALYETAGIPVMVAEAVMRGVKDADTQFVALSGIGTLFGAFRAEVVLANTLQTYWAIKAAKMANVPSIWAQHESEPWETYFDYLPPDMRPAAYEAFAEAYRVLYVAEATRRAWKPVETRGNFKVIRHGIAQEELASNKDRWTRQAARKALNVPEDAQVLSVVGTLCRRKGQLDLIQAYNKLPAELREKTYVFLAGALAESDYVEELRAAVGHTENIVLAGHTDDPFLYYAASDISICTSRVESAPRVIVEAMACGLPIITTPVFGIPELVRNNVNALFYQVGDANVLAELIQKMLGDDLLRFKLGANGPKVLAGQPGFKEMVEQYTCVIRQAVNLYGGRMTSDERLNRFTANAVVPAANLSENETVIASTAILRDAARW
jgi:GT2 family glycosyltransferase/glycosyltransferase involved in cell wall biosynthesis